MALISKKSKHSKTSSNNSNSSNPNSKPLPPIPPTKVDSLGYINKDQIPQQGSSISNPILSTNALNTNFNTNTSIESIYPKFEDMNLNIESKINTVNNIVINNMNSNINSLNNLNNLNNLEFKSIKLEEFNFNFDSSWEIDYINKISAQIQNRNSLIEYFNFDPFQNLQNISRSSSLPDINMHVDPFYLNEETPSSFSSNENNPFYNTKSNRMSVHSDLEKKSFENYDYPIQTPNRNLIGQNVSFIPTINQHENSNSLHSSIQDSNQDLNGIIYWKIRDQGYSHDDTEFVLHATQYNYEQSTILLEKLEKLISFGFPKNKCKEALLLKGEETFEEILDSLLNDN